MSVISTDVAIIGAGLAGSLCSGMLAMQGTPNLLIDPRTEYPNEFRCEKFDRNQIALLEETGLADEIFQELTPVKDVWMARFGKLVRKQTYPHYGFSYQEAVNAVRQHHVRTENFYHSTVTSIDHSTDSPILEISDGSKVKAKLVVLATGVNNKLQNELGMQQEMLSEKHCLAIGFDVEPGNDFDFDTMTYWPESSSGKMSYLTFFRTSQGWRANLFGYWGMRDETISNLKDDPVSALQAIMPNLQKITGQFDINGKLRVRPINLYQWHAPNLNGVVCIGDAWSSSCPGAGTGTTKAINDALILAKQFIPDWLAEEAISAAQVNAFYSNSHKRLIDQQSINEAYKLRNITLEKTMYWQAQRWLRFLYHGTRGKLAAG